MSIRNRSFSILLHKYYGIPFLPSYLVKIHLSILQRSQERYNHLSFFNSNKCPHKATGALSFGLFRL